MGADRRQQGDQAEVSRDNKPRWWPEVRWAGVELDRCPRLLRGCVFSGSPAPHGKKQKARLLLSNLPLPRRVVQAAEKSPEPHTASTAQPQNSNGKKTKLDMMRAGSSSVSMILIRARSPWAGKGRDWKERGSRHFACEHRQGGGNAQGPWRKSNKSGRCAKHMVGERKETCQGKLEPSDEEP